MANLNTKHCHRNIMAEQTKHLAISYETENKNTLIEINIIDFDFDVNYVNPPFWDPPCESAGYQSPLWEGGSPLVRKGRRCRLWVSVDG